MKTLYFLIGAPGSGKTTFLEKASIEIFGDDSLLQHVTSPDNIRLIVEAPYQKTNGEWGTSQKNERFVWSFINDILVKKAHAGELIIMDATHSRSRAVSAYKKFSDLGYRVVGIDFTGPDGVTIDEILAQNKKRPSFKHVDDDIVRAIHERCQTLEIPKWVEVIKPTDFVSHFNNVVLTLEKEIESILTIGDIHGCAEEFKAILDNHGIDLEQPNPKKGIVFVGDYFDRGYDPVTVFKIIQELKKKFQIWTLMGNHEEPLMFYKEYFSQVARDIQQFLVPAIVQNTIAKEAIDAEIQEYTQILDKKINRSSLSRSVHNFFTKGAFELGVSFYQVLIEKKEKELLELESVEEEALTILQEFIGKSYKQLDKLVEDLRKYPQAFSVLTEFIKRNKVAPDTKKDPITNFQKLKSTSVDVCKTFILSDLKYTEITSFVKQCSQMFNVDFHGKRILVTHGGLVDVPTKATPTADMIRGVGGYEDAKECMATFANKNPDVIQIFGHRNEEEISIQEFNVNGDVNLGLRAIEIYLDGTIETTEIAPYTETLAFFRKVQIKKAQKFKAKKLSAEEEGQGLIHLFQDHKHVDVKKLPNNIAAVNFTKDAFNKGVWDDITVKARGLFIDIKQGQTFDKENINVMARGYYKFFNLGERNGFSTREVKDLVYPIQAFEKANGYLGLLAVDDRDSTNPTWLFTSKSTTGGTFAGVFKTMIQPKLSPELMELVRTTKVTLVFEVIEPAFDPHIETYTKPELVLLDAIKNTLEFSKLTYDDMDKYLNLFREVPGAGLRRKEVLKTCETFVEYRKFVKEQNTHPILSDSGIEGIVFEDSSEPQNMFKLKTDWYSFWKKMRSQKIKIGNSILKTKERTGEAIMDKSTRIKFKSFLHTAEEFQVFEYMLDEAQKDIETFKSLNIIEVRQNFLKKIETGKDAA